MYSSVTERVGLSDNGVYGKVRRLDGWLMKLIGRVLLILFHTWLQILVWYLPRKKALPLILPIILLLKVTDTEVSIDRAIQVVWPILGRCWILKNEAAKSNVRRRVSQIT